MFNQPNGIGMRTCCISPNDQLMAVGAVDGTITVVEMESYKSLKLVFIITLIYIVMYILMYMRLFWS